jgi:hypothetical protein
LRHSGAFLSLLVVLRFFYRLPAQLFGPFINQPIAGFFVIRLGCPPAGRVLKHARE